jgi:PIN domain nuclease of toxin-antitoxin system
MTALLLDTHIWLWYAEGLTDRLRPAGVKKLEDARKEGGLLLSAISLWEIGELSARGRIQLSAPLRDWVNRAIAGPGIHFVPLDADTAVESTLLPGKPQGDPADRFLIATARTRNVALATRDRGILDYARLGFVRSLAL